MSVLEKKRTDAEDDGRRWKDPEKIRSDIRGLVIALVALIGLDFASAFVVSVAVPDETVLGWYLHESYPEVISGFRAGDQLVVPDAATGWRMKPNASMGSWETDAMGARIHDPFEGRTAEPTDVLLIGSSVVNGDTQAGSDETLGAYLESETLRARNFGTMLWSTDQALIAYQDRFSDLEHDVVVVGIHADHESEQNFFIPFQRRTEQNMPFLKPGIRLEGDGIEVVPMPAVDELDRDSWPEMLDFLEENDGSWDQFNTYRRFGITPLTSYLRDAWLKVRRRMVSDAAVQEGLEVQRRLVDAFADVVEENGARIIFVKFVYQGDHSSRIYAPITGDFNDAHDEMLRASGHEVLFAEEILNEMGVPLWELYRPDQVHLTATAYEAVAEAVRQRIESTTPNGG